MSIESNTKKKLNLLSKSPTFVQRQLSHGASVKSMLPLGASSSNIFINPALIANMQFTSNSSVNPSNSMSGGGQPTSTGSSGGVSNLTSGSSSQAGVTNFSIRQMILSPFNNKQYDSIIGLTNQQIAFCINYLTGQQSTVAGDNVGLQSNQSRLLNAGYLIPPSGHIRSSTHHHSSSTIFGVGMYYQLFEMQQIYRHPRKIYELGKIFFSFFFQ